MYNWRYFRRQLDLDSGKRSVHAYEEPKDVGYNNAWKDIASVVRKTSSY